MTTPLAAGLVLVAVWTGIGLGWGSGMVYLLRTLPPSERRSVTESLGFAFDVEDEKVPTMMVLTSVVRWPWHLYRTVGILKRYRRKR